MNEILFLISIVLMFGAVVFVSRYLGKAGLYAWSAGAVIIANLIVSKQIMLFGMNVTLGNVAFASTFLVTDILTELYGAKESKKAVNCSLLGCLLFITGTQIALLFIPSSQDFIHPAMREVFAMSIRMTAASIVSFYVANMSDVYLYDKMKKLIPGKMWLRNNVSTVLCNCTENFILTFLGFYGILDFNQCMAMAITTSIVESLVAFCDTPFLYWAKRLAQRSA